MPGVSTGRTDDEGEAEVTPEDVAERLFAWQHEPKSWHDQWLPDGVVTRRVAYVEQDGPRHTWTLTQGPTQVGHVRGRLGDDGLWSWETSRGIAREAIGLHDATQPGQTGG